MTILYLEEKQADKIKFLRYNGAVISDYMLVLVLSLCVPLALSFWPPLGFYRHSRSLAAALCWVLALFGSWDVWATWRGHWSFAADKVWPWRIINLPVEEVLFFLVIPFCCIFTWEAMLFLFSARPSRRRG